MVSHLHILLNFTRFDTILYLVEINSLFIVVAACAWGDCVTPYIFYNTQNNCTQEVRPAQYDCRWKAGKGTKCIFTFHLNS